MFENKLSIKFFNNVHILKKKRLFLHATISTLCYRYILLVPREVPLETRDRLFHNTVQCIPFPIPFLRYTHKTAFRPRKLLSCPTLYLCNIVSSHLLTELSAFRLVNLSNPSFVFITLFTTFPVIFMNSSKIDIR